MSSRGRPAQYADVTRNGNSTAKQNNSFRNKVEKDASKNGSHIPQAGGSDYYVHDAGKVVGYNNGKPTQYVRAEVTNKNETHATQFFHGHPISQSDYNTYMKGKK